jgi:aryl-alcohol dehydrogenase-like predicted oxidoreductase
MQVDRELGYRVADVLKRIASGRSASPSQVAIAWLLTKPFVSTVIVGANKQSQLEDNLKAADLVLSDAEVKELDELTAPKMLYPNGFYAMMDPVLSNAGRKS